MSIEIVGMVNLGVAGFLGRAADRRLDPQSRPSRTHTATCAGSPTW